MPRNRNIRYTLQRELDVQVHFGRKKHLDKQQTYKERKKAKSKGATLRERDEINHSKNIIYSENTLQTYLREVNKFADYLYSKGLSKITLEECTQYIQPYMNYLVDKRLSSTSIHTALARICKATHTYMRDFSIPQRSIADTKRGKKAVRNDKYNEKNHREILEANRLFGLRRNELKNLKVKDIEFRADGVVLVHTKGKGGKNNVQVFTDENEIQRIKEYIQGKLPNDRVFSPNMFKNDCDLHHQRELRAKDVYNKVCEDMAKNPNRREYYRDYIFSEFEIRDKKVPNNIDIPYICRGKNRERLIREGKPIQYDRIASMYVSLTVLNHYRVDTTIQNYISK